MPRAPEARDGRRAAPARDVDPAVERFLAGDEQTVAATLGAIRAAVASRGFYVPVDDRPELVSETMIHLLQYLKSANPGRPRALEAVARTMAYRRCVDWMRRHRPTSELPETVRVAPAQERATLDRERAALGARARAEIRADCQELIRRHSVEGESFREIAERDGRLEKTVRNQLSKCLQRARVVLRRMQRRDRLTLASRREA